MKVRSSIRPTHPRKVKTPQQANEKKTEEKKNSNTNNNNNGASSSAPKVVKSNTNKRTDIFEVQKPFVTSFSCVSDVVRAFNDGTDELRNLLNFECDLIYECQICRSLFRSLANFLQHKRFHCLERARDLKKNVLNGEITDKMVHINGTNPKGQLLATRKTMKKDIYDILKKVGDMTEEPLPEQFFTRDIQATDAALLSFFKQEGKAATEDRSATVGPNGYEVSGRSAGSITADKPSKVSQASDVSSDVSSKQSDSSSRQSDSSGRPSKDDSRSISAFRCLKCDETFSSPSELTAHSNLRNCTKLRKCYVCPLCKKIVATPWNVYRHIRRVHNKSVEQVRKLRKTIEKKMVRAEEIKTRNMPSPIRKPVMSEKTQEMIRSYQKVNHVSVEVNCAQTQLSNPVMFKRGRSPETDVPAKSRIIEDSSSSISPQANPPKRVKIEKDLSWLKKGPSVPIVGGPLTRTARALYGSPRKINPTESDKVEWNKSMGKIDGEVTIKEESDCNEPAPDRSTQDELSESPSGPEDGSPSDGDDNDSDNASDSEEKKTKNTSSINKRLSSSEDNVRSLTSSVDSLDSSPSKEKTTAQDLHDQTSTSGVETEVDRPATTSSGGASDDESADVDHLIHLYSRDAPLINYDAYQSNQTTSNHRDSAKGTLENIAQPHNISSNAAAPVKTKPVAPSARRRSMDSLLQSSHSPAREANETEHSSCSLAVSLEEPEEVNPYLDSDDSNPAREEEHDDQLRMNMMEVIFGTLPTTSFNFTSVRNSSSS